MPGQLPGISLFAHRPLSWTTAEYFGELSQFCIAQFAGNGSAQRKALIVHMKPVN
jgi:hypothetical protein